MTHTTHILLATLALACCLACKEKPRTGDIIVPKPQPVKADNTVRKMSDVRTSHKAQWRGATCDIGILRTAADSLPTVRDENTGKVYADNTVAITIRHAGATRTHHIAKADFRAHLTPDYYAHSILLGLVFTSADAQGLHFAASVGAPDELDDDYTPFLIDIDAQGRVSIAKDDRLDTSADME